MGVQTGSDTTSRTNDLLSIGRTVVAVARQEQITLMAASLAYYLFTALVPLLLFSVIALSLFGHGLLGQLSGTASGTVLPSGVSVPKTLLANTQGRFRAAVLGAVILAWSALRTFGALDGAFAAVYDEREEVSLVDKAVDAVIVFVTVGLATVALALVGGALALTVKDRLLLRVASPLFLFVTLAVVFAPLYLPPAGGRGRHARRDPSWNLARSARLDGLGGRRPTLRDDIEQCAVLRRRRRRVAPVDLALRRRAGAAGRCGAQRHARRSRRSRCGVAADGSSVIDSSAGRGSYLRLDRQSESCRGPTTSWPFSPTSSRSRATSGSS